MKIWTISDTHCKHNELIIPDGIDMVIHAGDASNHRDYSMNGAQMRDFLDWYNNLPIKYKIYVPGNHDTSIEKGMHNFEDYPEITVLINDSVTIEGIKIYGSPITPSFGQGWSYNCSRGTIGRKYWDRIEHDVNILITHGPPKGILDYTESRDFGNQYVQCGCKSLFNAVKRIQPTFHIFGHVHDEPNVINVGKFKPIDYKTTFINAAICNLRYNVENNGQIIEI